MPLRNLSLALSVCVGTLLVGCGGGSESTVAEPELTPEQAKTAMIDLLRTTQLDYLHEYPLDKFVNEPVKIQSDGVASWADFHFHLKSRTYSYHVNRGEPNTKMFFAASYEGTFELKQGKWVATKARCTSIT